MTNVIKTSVLLMLLGGWGVLGCGGDAPEPTAQGADALEPGTYLLQSPLSGKCMEVAGSAMNNGANVQQAACTRADNQQWQVLARPDGSYRLRAKHSQKCLRAADSQPTYGMNVQQGRCVYQRTKWIVDELPGGVIELANARTGRCAEVSGSSTDVGANVGQAACTDGENQRFRLVAPDGDLLPPAGNAEGTCAVPVEAQLEDTSVPTVVIGDGTPASCDSDAVVAGVAQGGIITFDCGPDPVTIPMTATAKIYNNTGPKIVIDGGGLVTLDGGNTRRILYMNTCDQDLVWTTPQCQNQDHPQLTVQNLTFTGGNSTFDYPGEGGGAIYARGGRFKVINSRFFNNACDDVGPDVGGASVRVLSQYEGLPAYVVGCTFGGRYDLGNVCSNGGGLSSIGVSYTVLNTLFSHNDAIGYGANPAESGTPGGGSGGAIYNDGNLFALSLCGTRIEHNHANEGGGAIFYVSNDGTGSMVIDQSVLRDNPSDGFETTGLPGIFYLSDVPAVVTNSTLE